jgi:hypothetical protein
MCEWKEQDPHCHVDPVTRLKMQPLKTQREMNLELVNKANGRPVKQKNAISREWKILSLLHFSCACVCG